MSYIVICVLYSEEKKLILYYIINIIFHSPTYIIAQQSWRRYRVSPDTRYKLSLYG